MENKLTYQDVLDETIEYYKTNPRGYDAENSKCVYLGPNGEMCAVGRCLIDPNNFESDVNARSLINDYGMEIFKEEYRHLDNKGFWSYLQQFHDKNFKEIFLSDVKECIEEIENEQNNS